jgi:hypothetical protein
MHCTLRLARTLAALLGRSIPRLAIRMTRVYNPANTPDMGMSLWGESPLWEDPMSSG